MTDTLFQRYGGFATISRVVMAFYDKVLTCGTTTVAQTCTAGSEIASHHAAR